MASSSRHIRLLTSNIKYLKKYLPVNKCAIANPSVCKRSTVILGIESSCDDTGCAIVDSDGNILADALNSQQIFHLSNGGIIPPLAQDLHRKNITRVCETALKSADMRLRDIDAIAVTVKPGIPTSLLIGLNFGKYLSEVGCKPLIPIHHMEAHALTARIVEKIEFPYLTLLISGGHCLLAIVENVDKFYLLGTTMDIAPGDILDKAGRRMKLNNIPDFQNMCGGAAIELAANQATDMEQFQFPLTLMHQKDCNFSYTGLLNTIYLYINEQEKEHNIQGDMIIPDVYNLCAGIQFTIARHLCHRTQRAMEFFNSSHMVPEGNRTLVVSGGVASNNFFAKSLSFLCSEMGYKFFRPPHKLCTDNGIMVAWNGMERWKINSGVLTTPDEIDKLKVEHKSPLGTDWREYVIDKNIKCTWVKVKRAHAN